MLSPSFNSSNNSVVWRSRVLTFIHDGWFPLKFLIWGCELRVSRALSVGSHGIRVEGVFLERFWVCSCQGRSNGMTDPDRVICSLFLGSHDPVDGVNSNPKSKPEQAVSSKFPGEILDRHQISG